MREDLAVSPERFPYVCENSAASHGLREPAERGGSRGHVERVQLGKVITSMCQPGAPLCVAAFPGV